MADAYAAWARRLRASDEAALREVMGVTHAPLLRYAVRFTHDRDAAYDVLQEAFLRLWNARATLDETRSLRAFLYRIVYHLALNHTRMSNREAAVRTAMPDEVEAGGASAADELDAQRLGERLAQWIAELPPRRQEAFRLSRFDGLSHDEIAEIMDLAPTTVTTHIMLALQHLRDRLRAYQMEGYGL